MVCGHHHRGCGDVCTVHGSRFSINPLCSPTAEAAGLLLSPQRGTEVLSMAAALHPVSQTASAIHPPFKTGLQEASNCKVNIAYTRTTERCWGRAGCCPRAGGGRLMLGWDGDGGATCADAVSICPPATDFSVLSPFLRALNTPVLPTARGCPWKPKPCLGQQPPAQPSTNPLRLLARTEEQCCTNVLE